MKKLIFIPLALSLAACSGNDEVASGTFDDGEGGEGSFSVKGDEDDSEMTIKTDKGEVKIATGDKASEDLPMGIKIYPGAELQSSMSGMGEGKSGAMIVFKSNDDQDDVISFYKDQMDDKGIEVKAEINTGPMKMISGERKDGEALNVSVAKEDEGGVVVTLIAGGKS